MPAALPFIAVALSATSAVKQHQAGKKADKLAEANAKLQEQQTAEEARRLAKEQEKVESTAKARAAAGGAQVSGSQALFLADMKSEHGKELAWLQKSGQSKAAATRQGGSNARSQATAGALGTAAGAASTAYSAFGT